MKNNGLLCILLILAILLVPLAVIGGDLGKKEPEAPPESDPIQTPAGEKEIRVLRTATGEVVTLPELDYVRGAVSAEMSPVYHEEAIKAQAAACYTYAVKMRTVQRANPDAALKGADLSDDSSRHQAYLSDEELRTKWGDKYGAYADKVAKAVQAVAGKLILYDGQPITVAFHAICSGQTERAQVMWGNDVPYLQSVPSPGDRLSPDYASTIALTKEQFAQAAEKLEGVKLGGDASGWLGEMQASPGGTVTAVTIGGKQVAGDQVREAFGLRSACFTVTYAADTFTFHVTGYGHGVGMSQYGADYMARQGSTWEEILRHYYTGATVG